MFRPMFFATAIVILSLSAPAASDAWLKQFVAHQDEGLHPAESLPANLQSAADKVLVLVFATRQTVLQNPDNGEQITEQKELRQIELMPFKTKLPRSEKLANPAGYAKTFVAGDFECAKTIEYGKRRCQFNRELIHCSAFAIGDGTELWTAKHCIRHWLKNSVENDDKVVYLFDQTGRKLFGPLKPQEFQFPSAVLNYEWGLRTLGEDSIAFKIPGKIKNTFQVAEAAPFGATVYALGFPAATGMNEFKKNSEQKRFEFRPRRDGLNGAAGEFRFGRGVFLDQDRARQLEKYFEPETLREIYEKTDNVFLATSDCVEGSSGGPVINSEGKVVGLISGAIDLVVGASSGDFPIEAIETTTVIVRPPQWKPLH